MKTTSQIKGKGNEERNIDKGAKDLSNYHQQKAPNDTETKRLPKQRALDGNVARALGLQDSAADHKEKQ